MPNPDDRRTIAEARSSLEDGKAIKHAEGVELLEISERLLNALDQASAELHPTPDAWAAANRALEMHWARLHRIEKLRDEWAQNRGISPAQSMAMELTKAMADPDASEEQKFLQATLAKIVDRRDYAASHAPSQWQRYANAETVINELLMESQGIEFDPYG
jgi:hypothetical protein